MKKNFEAFVASIVTRINEAFPNYETRLNEVAKSGNTTKRNLVVRDPEFDAAPALRIDDYYDKYREADNYEDVFEEIVEEVLDIIPKSMQDAKGMNIGDKAKDAIENWRENATFSLVLKDGNERFLSERPYMEFLDMAKVYSLNVDNLIEGHVSRVAINNEHFESFRCSLEELDEAAMANTIRKNPVEIDSMLHVLAELMGMPEDQFEMMFGPNDIPMYVVSNRTKCDGAATIAYPEVLEQICDAMNADGFYLLPSSRHECIAIPENVGKDVAALRCMVHEVNSTQVPPEDLLSENVYRYKRGGELKIAEDEPAEISNFEPVGDGDVGIAQ